jgi:hypothetical protein
MRRLHWTKVQLWDAGGYQPDEHQLARCMREFRDHNSIADYWLYDPTTCRFEEEDFADAPREHIGRVWDDFNKEYNYPEDVGPSRDEIDFSGLV